MLASHRARGDLRKGNGWQGLMEVASCALNAGGPDASL